MPEQKLFEISKKKILGNILEIFLEKNPWKFVNEIQKKFLEKKNLEKYVETP